MKFYCTKYWATQGIIEFKGEVAMNGEFAKETTSHHSWGTLFLRIGKDAFVDLKDAKANVVKKAEANVRSKDIAAERARELAFDAHDGKIKVVKR